MKLLVEREPIVVAFLYEIEHIAFNTIKLVFFRLFEIRYEVHIVEEVMLEFNVVIKS